MERKHQEIDNMIKQKLSALENDSSNESVKRTFTALHKLISDKDQTLFDKISIDMAKVNAEKVYDYTGCLYPEGLLSSEQIALFDHEQIETVYHMGLADDEEEKNFKAKLVELQKIKNN